MSGFRNGIFQENIGSDIMSTLKTRENSLGTTSIGSLLLSLAVPAIIANVVNALYNIVDQIFIGHGIGKLGNASTNVSFPLTTICMAIGLMAGLGSASGFNLELGKKNEKRARSIAGTAAVMLVISGVIISILLRIFLDPLLILFGATENIMPYASEYAGITLLGIPFLMFSTGINPLIRADRSSRYSMTSVILGAILNLILDPIFIFVLDLGIKGAAWATVISQLLSALMMAVYFAHFKSVRFEFSDFIPRYKEIGHICKLGFNVFVFQFSNLLIQIVMNNMLRTYGEKSIYGGDTPIAAAGIVMKISVIFFALINGLINGAQPICSYNYGAEKYGRVRDTVKMFMKLAVIISAVMWLIFELFPKPLISLFGSTSDDVLYFDFAVKFMRKYLFFTLINGVQICSVTFFPAIEKATKGTILSFTKQLVFRVPLLLIMPLFFGLDGVMYAQMMTDLLSFSLVVVFLIDEFRKMPKHDL